MPGRILNNEINSQGQAKKTGEWTMARRKEAGTLKLTILSAALIGGLALPAQAEQLELSATTTLTTDYVFRGVSQTGNEPAIQGSLDAAYGIFYAGVWGSNVDFSNSLELDWYGGITPSWQGIDFDIGVIYYTYPGDNGIDFVEIKTGGSYTFGESFTVGVTNYWDPDNENDALEAGAEYAFSGKLFNYFTPSVSGLVGWQWFDAGGDYTYWNAGLTLGFMDNWSLDVRYWDSDLSDTGCGDLIGWRNACDGRVVGTISASF
jgi:uncharacterized protein (TIGR02001 family)